VKRLASIAAFVAGQALAQAPCPGPDDVAPQQLFGEWKAEFQGSWEIATLRLVKHPEYGGSFRGTLEREGSRAQVAGDLEDGEFTLEESADGKRIAATWLGDVVEGSCGREIRGTWTRDGEASGRDFVLRKQ
jgi:hypothetical protein